MENKTEVIQHVLKVQLISLSFLYITWISRGVFLCVYAYANVSYLKVNDKTAGKQLPVLNVSENNGLPVVAIRGNIHSQLSN